MLPVQQINYTGHSESLYIFLEQFIVYQYSHGVNESNSSPPQNLATLVDKYLKK